MANILFSDSLTQARLKSLGATEKDYVYNCLDCCVTHEVWGVLHPQLNPLTAAIYRFERNLQGPVLEMNLRGILVDKVYRAKAISGIHLNITRVEHNLNAILLGAFSINDFNWNSPQQAKHLLYDVMGLPPQKHQGSITSNRDALEKLRDLNFYAQPLINHILCLRGMQKRVSAIKTSMDDDGRIRTTYGIAATTTGRFASYGSAFDTGGNLQNLEEQIRQMFVADPGYKFAYIDLEQAESRALGAKCWNLFHQGAYLDACETEDVHTGVARSCWPTRLKWTGDLSKDKAMADELLFYRTHSFRHMTKILGHGTNYWGQPWAMSKHTKIPVEVITEFQADYFKAFPELKLYHNWAAQELATKGYTVSLMGRPRWFFGRRNDDSTIREFIAYDPQSSVADILNRGLLTLWRARLCQILLQVHDALLIQYPEHLEDEIVPKAAKLLELPVPLLHNRTLTIPTDVKVGWNWGPVSTSNPDGMKKYKEHDDRKRLNSPALSLLDRRL